MKSDRFGLSELESEWVIGRRRGRDTRVGGTIKSPRDVSGPGREASVQRFETARGRERSQESRQEGYYGELWDGLPLPCGQERTLGREYDIPQLRGDLRASKHECTR